MARKEVRTQLREAQKNIGGREQLGGSGEKIWGSPKPGGKSTTSSEFRNHPNGAA